LKSPVEPLLSLFLSFFRPSLAQEETEEADAEEKTFITTITAAPTTKQKPLQYSFSKHQALRLEKDLITGASPKANSSPRSGPSITDCCKSIKSEQSKAEASFSLSFPSFFFLLLTTHKSLGLLILSSLFLFTCIVTNQFNFLTLPTSHHSSNLQIPQSLHSSESTLVN
jgi:hypothetical protein